MPLSLALVFHFNQHTNEYAHVANRACYRGLLNVLRAHPTLKFNIHISGTLLRALNWFDPETVELIRVGMAEGQFELLGSTYAQNVPYASDDWDNAQQIGLHQVVLERAFGVKPVVFWNSERSWRQSLVPVIAEGGYLTSLIEDHVFQAAGMSDPVPISIAYEQHTLTAVYDDTVLRERFNYAVWFGRRAQLFNYLKSLAERPGSEHFFVTYAEDAEAMGLWGWEKGYLPHAAWAYLDSVLKEFEKSDETTLQHLSTAQPRQSRSPLPDRAARWMNRALNDAKLPYHEDGYQDWFDFLQRSPKVAYFQKLYSVVRTRLQALGSARQDPGFPKSAQTPADTFYRQAIETFCHHQYEFGCIGVGGRSYWGWENVRTAFLFARVTEIAEEPRPRRWIEDINGDGSDEQLLCDGWNLAVLTAYGGRLLYWFDLAEGRQWVGNQLAIPRAPYLHGATKQPEPVSLPKVWLPDSFGADLRPWKLLKTKEPSPTRLGARMPDWIFDREPSALTVYRKRMRQPGQRLALRAQTGSFSDSITLNETESFPADHLLDYRLEPGGVFCYLNYLTPTVVVEKRIRQTGDGLTVHYTLDNQDHQPHLLRLSLSNELCPDYAEVLASGRESLTFRLIEDRYPGVVNTHTHNALALKPSQMWTQVRPAANLLALEVELTFEFSLEPRATQTFEVELSIYRA